jgi:death on curing protein
VLAYDTAPPWTPWPPVPDLTRFLSPQDLLVLARAEAGAAVRVDEEALGQVAAEPAQTTHGIDMFPGLHVKAAVLLSELVCRRVFGPDSERVGLLAVVVFLNLNGMDVDADGGDLAELTRLVGRGELSLLEAAAGLEAASVRLLLHTDPPLDPSPSPRQEDA